MKKSELIENSNRYRRLKRGLFGDPSGKIRTFAIISAENPLGWKDSTEEEFKQRFVQWFDDKKLYNKQSVDRIESTVLLHKIEKNGDTGLRYGGFVYVPLKGKYGDLEKSYIIFNLTLSDAKTIARDYGQESFFFANVSENRSIIAYYVTSDGCKTYKSVDVSETISDETEAEDYFSKFGFKFRINMKEFGDDVPEVIDKSAFEESFDEEIRNFSARALKRRQAYRNTNDQLDEGYEDLISYMATGNKKKLSKKRKNQKKALSFFGNAGNPKYNADFFNHVMGSDGGEFGSVNGTDMVAGDMSLSIGGNTGGGDSAGGAAASSGGGMGESLNNSALFETKKHKSSITLEDVKQLATLNNTKFITEDGVPILLNFLGQQPLKAKQKILKNLIRLDQLGANARRPLADLLRDGIHELRTDLDGIHYRCLYFLDGNSVVVVAQGLTKEAEVPNAEIEKALKYKLDYFTNKK